MTEKAPAVVAAHVSHFESADRGERKQRVVDQLERVVQIEHVRLPGEQLEQPVEHTPVVGRQAIAHGAGHAHRLLDVEPEAAAALAIDQSGRQVVHDRGRDAAGQRLIDQILTHARAEKCGMESGRDAVGICQPAQYRAEQPRAVLASLRVTPQPEQVLRRAARRCGLAVCLARPAAAIDRRDRRHRQV